MLYYCKKCGRIVNLYPSDEKTCDYCSNLVIPVPNKYLDEKVSIALNDDLKEQFINECIKCSPEFDQYLFDHRGGDMKKLREQREAELDQLEAFMEEKNRVPRCPICQSTNLSRLSSLGKALKVGIFGLYGADDFGKTYKCNHCGSKF